MSTVLGLVVWHLTVFAFGLIVGQARGWNGRIKHEREAGPAAIFGWQNIMCPRCKEEFGEPPAQPQGDDEPDDDEADREPEVPRG